MNRIVRSVLVCSGAMLGIASLSAAQQFTLSDGNSSARFNTNTAAGQDQWVVNGLNHMNQQWFWIRAGTDTRENSLNTLVQQSVATVDTNAFSDNRVDTLSVLYRDTNNRFSVEANFTIRGGGGTSFLSDITEQLRITNIQSTGNLTLSLFEYVDLNINGTANDTSGAIQNGRVAVQDEAGLGSSEVVVTPAPSRFQVALTPAILNALNDAAVTNLTNAAGPVGPGDVSWAFQWDVTLAPGQVLLVSKDKQISIIPTPGSMGLAMIGAALLVRRRRA
jgi:uncharacterized protein (TIGR03382 family)